MISSSNKFFFVHLIILAFSSASFAEKKDCPNFTGYWYGDCIYESKLHGTLKGFYDVAFKQDQCSSLTINETHVSIPGERTDRYEEDNDQFVSVVKLWWDEENNSRLNFHNELIAHDEDGHLVDDVSMTGSFIKHNDRKVFMKQSGRIDTDEVTISCELKR